MTRKKARHVKDAKDVKRQILAARAKDRRRKRVARKIERQIRRNGS
jgi:hypothetical protein